MTGRLYRSRTDRVLGGVAAGVARWMNADPALVRIGWAILVPLTSGFALLAYIVAWVVVPEAPFESAAGAPVEGEVVDETGATIRPAASTTTNGGGWSGDRGALVIGGGLVLLGLWFLLRQFLPPINWSLIWPLILVGIGALILYSTTRNRSGN